MDTAVCYMIDKLRQIKHVHEWPKCVNKQVLLGSAFTLPLRWRSKIWSMYMKVKKRSPSITNQKQTYYRETIMVPAQAHIL